MSTIRHITLPKGFVAAGVTCGIKQSAKPDIAVIAGLGDCSVAFVTTTNQIVGAPIQYVRGAFPRGCGKARAFVVNSGNSNVCTGKAGLADAKMMAKVAADKLGTGGGKVLIASTGVIGHRLPMAKIKRGITKAVDSISLHNDNAAAMAILTTDLRPKSALVQTRIGGKAVTVAGIAKGSGMVAPSLATMIACLTTDAAISPAVLKKALLKAVRTTFNAVTIDSDTSTSDIVVVLASGAAGNSPVKAETAAYKKFVSVLTEVCGELARSIVADGEGATKVIEITVRGARSNSDAEAAAKSVANSPLLKTAVHGADPNWGRIAMALGKSSAKVVAEKLKIQIAGQVVFAGGVGRKFNARTLSKHLSSDNVAIACDLGLGKGRFTALTCDLSREYIAINADYTT